MFIETILVAFVSFLIGAIFHQTLKDYVFYKFVWSPIEICSDHPRHKDMLKYGINVDKQFEDTITIYNKTNDTIMIRQLEVKTTPLEKQYSKKRFSVFLHKDQDRLNKSISMNVKNKFRGTTTSDINLLPIILKPKEYTKVYFGILADTEKGKEIDTTISIEPVYDYKISKLKYFVIFRHDND